MPKLELILRTEKASRLDLALLAALAGRGTKFSRSQLKEWFGEKKVLVRGSPALASLLLEPGETQVALLDWDPERAASVHAHSSRNGAFLPVVFEDDELLILHKSSGVPSVPHRSDETETAVGAALALRPELSGVGRGGLEPGILHRLDNATSGLLAFAKTAEAYRTYHELWKKRSIRKFYRALVAPSPGFRAPTLPHLIRWPMGHDAKSAARMVVLKDGIRAPKLRGEALEAVTRILEIRALPGGLLDVEVRIDTGVMHQIRAHLAAFGLPLLGDTRYGGPESSRIWLHASRLEIPPPKGPLIVVHAALPAAWASHG